MSEPAFSVRIRYSDGEVGILCHGSLDSHAALRLREVVTPGIAAQPPRLLLDCRNVNVLTAAGVAALADIAVACSDAQIPLTLETGARVRRILDLVGLWWLGVVHDGVAIQRRLQEVVREFEESGDRPVQGPTAT